MTAGSGTSNRNIHSEVHQLDVYSSAVEILAIYMFTLWSKTLLARERTRLRRCAHGIEGIPHKP